MGGSAAETIRQPRDRLKGQPRERQHSAATWRDAGPTAPGEGFRVVRQGWKPEGRRRLRLRSRQPARAENRAGTTKTQMIL
jgi:hypothetical protein